MAVPQYFEMFNPTIQSLKELGGSGVNAEINAEIADLMGLTEAQRQEIHKDKATKLSYRASWARTYLRMYGLIKSTGTARWELTPQGWKTTEVNVAEVNHLVKRLRKGQVRKS